MITLMKSFPGSRRRVRHVHYFKRKGITYAYDMISYRWKVQNSFYSKRPSWMQPRDLGW